MSFGHPLLLLTLLVLPAGLVALPPASRGGGHAVRGAVHERRRARGGRRDRAAVAALARGRRLPPRARDALRRRVAAPRAPPRRERQRDGRARARRLGLDAGDRREADAPDRRAARAAHVPRRRCRRASRSASSSSRARRRSRRRRRPTTGSSPRRSTRSTSSTASAAPRSATRSRPPCRSGCAPPACTADSVTRAAAARQLAAYVTARSARRARSCRSSSSRTATRRAASCTPLQGADRARAAGFPVYTVSLGTTGNTTMRGYPQGFGAGAARLGGGVRPARPRARPEDAARDRRPHGRQVLPREIRRRSRGRVRGARLEARPQAAARPR